jgi:acid stress chaperone HdeB
VRAEFDGINIRPRVVPSRNLLALIAGQSWKATHDRIVHRVVEHEAFAGVATVRGDADNLVEPAHGAFLLSFLGGWGSAGERMLLVRRLLASCERRALFTKRRRSRRNQCLDSAKMQCRIYRFEGGAMRTIVGALVAGVLFCCNPAVADEIDLSTWTCKKFLSASKEDVGVILAWLDGYYADDDDPPSIDMGRLVANAKKLGEYCTAHPNDHFIDAANKLFKAAE